MQSNSITIEGLAAKLNSLQNDYDYLNCIYELDMLELTLEIFAHNINQKTTDLKFSYYHHKKDYDIYYLYRSDYNGDVALFDAYKESIKIKKEAIDLNIQTLNFSDKRVDILKVKCESLDIKLRRVEVALKGYKTYIDMYKK